MLPSSESIIKVLNRIIEVFSNPIEIEVVKTRWEEIKRLQFSTPYPKFNPIGQWSEQKISE